MWDAPQSGERCGAFYGEVRVEEEEEKKVATGRYVLT
jgi:hypothetical protein